MMRSAYLAAAGFEAQLRVELGERIVAEHGRLMLCDGPATPAAWAANIWQAPQEIEIASISDAAARLRALQRNWALYAPAHFRRARLIAEKLPHVSARPLTFPQPAPAAPLGSWTLLAPDRLLVSAQCSSPFPNGEVEFVEDRSGPPNRAYLKLWEALTRLRRYPQPGELCLDLGASPGGWSWVLAKLGARVIAVDKAKLEPRIAALPTIEWRQDSAFALDPAAFGAVDWLCCDVVCYPARLLKLVQRFLAQGRVRNFVCTLKFQGETDHDSARAFAAIPGSQLFHLHHNKHELTWCLPRP
ncbi:MAG: SAM-dependent methyltransferase [Reyranellaceae bacterium]